MLWFLVIIVVLIDIISVTNIHQNKTHNQNKGNINKSVLNMTDFNELKATIRTYAFMIIIGAFRIRDCFLKFSLEYFMLNSVLWSLKINIQNSTFIGFIMDYSLLNRLWRIEIFCGVNYEQNIVKIRNCGLGKRHTAKKYIICIPQLTQSCVLIKFPFKMLLVAHLVNRFSILDYART